MADRSNELEGGADGTISFCIPCYRSEQTIAGVVGELRAAMGERPGSFDYEILCVNDCSPDGVGRVLRQLADEDSRIKVVELSSNSGKHAALLAAFRVAQGSIAVCLDDDGQCPVDRLWELVDALDDDSDMSMARYPEAHYSGMKGLYSNVNNRLSCYLFDKPGEMRFSNFNARKRFLYKAMAASNGAYPNLEGMTLSLTRRIAFVDMTPRKRAAGTSGFSFLKGLRLWLDGALAYSEKPARLVLVAGLGLLLLSALSAVVAGLSGFGAWALWAAVLCVVGVILSCSGALGAYLSRIYRIMVGPPCCAIRATRNLDVRFRRDDLGGECEDHE